MRIALGLDLADKKCAAYAVPVGKAKKAQREFLDGFNKDFRRVPTTKVTVQYPRWISPSKRATEVR